MKIVPVTRETSPIHRQLARLLVLGFQEQSPDAWPHLDAGLETVREVLHDGFARAALDNEERAIGWIGGIPAYGGRVYELHPLVVDPAQQRRGIGRALVSAFEHEAKNRGALTAWVGADDEAAGTTLAGVDLYTDLPARLGSARVVGKHPLGFYQKLGYVLAGVLPDANGRGKPDLFLARRL